MASFEAKSDDKKRPGRGLGLFLVRNGVNLRLVLDELVASEQREDAWKKHVFVSSWSLGRTELSMLSDQQLADLGATIVACLGAVASDEPRC